MTAARLRRDDELHSETEASENAPLIGGEAGPALCQAQPPLVVSRPAPGQTVVLDVSPDQVIVLNFEPASAQVRIEGDDLVLGFDDDGDGQADSSIVFQNLAAAGAEEVSFQIGGATVPADLLVSQALARSEEHTPELQSEIQSLERISYAALFLK